MTYPGLNLTALGQTLTEAEIDVVAREAEGFAVIVAVPGGGLA